MHCKVWRRSIARSCPVASLLRFGERPLVEETPPARSLFSSAQKAFLLPGRLLDARASLALGAACVAASLITVFAAASELRRAKTAFDVRKPAARLVTTGAFAYSRNPVYLSMMTLRLGIALLTNSPWAFAFLAPTGSALRLLAIRPEERYLERKFGVARRNYKASVPRWMLARLAQRLERRSHCGFWK